VCEYALKLGVKLAHEVTKNFIHLCLSLNELLHQALQVRLFKADVVHVEIEEPDIWKPKDEGNYEDGEEDHLGFLLEKFGWLL